MHEAVFSACRDGKGGLHLGAPSLLARTVHPATRSTEMHGESEQLCQTQGGAGTPPARSSPTTDQTPGATSHVADTGITSASVHTKAAGSEHTQLLRFSAVSACPAVSWQSECAQAAACP